MPTIALPLDPRRRAMLEVEVGVPAARARALLQAGLPVPSPQLLAALIDPGASRTCIDHGVRRALNLRAFAAAAISTPSSSPAGTGSFHLYKVNLVVLHPSGNPQWYLAKNAFTVAAIHVAHMGTDVVLGRDLLALCRFVYDGRAGTFSLEY
jgi:hypothetical protein